MVQCKCKLSEEWRSKMNIAMFLKPKVEVEYLYDDFTVRQALEKMCRHGYTAIPVITRDGKYYSTIKEGDLLL